MDTLFRFVEPKGRDNKEVHPYQFCGGQNDKIKRAWNKPEYCRVQLGALRRGKLFGLMVLPPPAHRRFR
jgi:hypothetical protein